MRVVEFGWSTPCVFEYGGLDTFGRELSKALSKLGYDVLWVGTSPDPAHQGIHNKCGFKQYVAGVLTGLNDADLFRLRACFRGLVSDADLIIVHDMHTMPDPIIEAQANNIPAVIYEHVFGGEPYEIASIMTVGKVGTNSRLMKELISGWINSLRNVLNDMQLPYYGKEPLIQVIHPAVPELPEPRDDDLRKVEELGNYVLVHGRKQPNKNQESVTEVIRELRNEGMNVNLVISGRGWSINDLVGEGIILLGEVSDTLLTALYRKALACVLPSTFEPYGMVALECASQGTPVIISENAGVKETLTKALTYDPNNPKELEQLLKEVLSNEGLRNVLGKKIKEQAIKREWVDVAKEIIKLGLLRR